MIGQHPRIWITRAEPGAGRTATRLQTLGFQPVVAPLLIVERIEGVEIDLTGVDALAFTSINGVSAFAALSDRRDLRVFCVGDATAEAAQRAGFADVRSAAGDVEALGRLIAEAQVGGLVLAPGAECPAGDLAAAAGNRVRVRRVALYRTVDARPAVPRCDAVLIHSPRAAQALRPLIDAAPAPPQAVCISAAAAQPLVDAVACTIADHPDEDRMIAALQATLGKALPPV